MKSIYTITCALFALFLSATLNAQTKVTWNSVSGNTMTGTANLGGTTGIVTVTATITTASTGTAYGGGTGRSNTGHAVGGSQSGVSTFISNANAAWPGTTWANTNVLYFNHDRTYRPSILTFTFDKPVLINQLVAGDIDANDGGSAGCSNNFLLPEWNDGFQISGTTFSSVGTANTSTMTPVGVYSTSGVFFQTMVSTGTNGNATRQLSAELNGDNLVRFST